MRIRGRANFKVKSFRNEEGACHTETKKSSRNFRKSYNAASFILVKNPLLKQIHVFAKVRRLGTRRLFLRTFHGLRDDSVLQQTIQHAGYTRSYQSQLYSQLIFHREGIYGMFGSERPFIGT